MSRGRGLQWRALGDVGDRILATGGLPAPDFHNGFGFPGIAVRPSHDTLDHLQPSVVVHIGGQHDTQVDLVAHEAWRLIQRLLPALDVLEGKRDVSAIAALDRW